MEPLGRAWASWFRVERFRGLGFLCELGEMLLRVKGFLRVSTGV